MLIEHFSNHLSSMLFKYVDKYRVLLKIEQFSFFSSWIKIIPKYFIFVGCYKEDFCGLPFQLSFYFLSIGVGIIVLLMVIPYVSNILLNQNGYHFGLIRDTIFPKKGTKSASFHLLLLGCIMKYNDYSCSVL